VSNSKKKLKIGITIDVFNAINGGVISTRRIVDLLRERGHEVYVFAAGEDNNDPYFVPMKAFYVPLAKGIMKKLKMPLAKPVDSLMRPIFKELDIVHYMFPFWLGYKSLQLAKELNKPVISTFHVQVEHIFKNIHFEPDYLISKGYKLLVNKLYNKTDFLFCPSKFAHDEILRFGLKTPSIVLTNGVGPIFTPKIEARPKELEDKFIIISVGRLTPEKSHKTIIEAILKSQYRDKIQLLIFGEGPLATRLMNHATKLPHPLIINIVDAKELAYYYNIADLYIHASEIETEGLAPLEASACGTPLLISDSAKSASGQFALTEESLFTHGSIADLAHKIDYWIERPQELQNLGNQYAQEAGKYQISKVVDIIEDKYYELVDNFVPADQYKTKLSFDK
jgi:glycosyltransferase involved in cell wall biosynthesis